MSEGTFSEATQMYFVTCASSGQSASEGLRSFHAEAVEPRLST